MGCRNNEPLKLASSGQQKINTENQTNELQR